MFKLVLMFPVDNLLLWAPAGLWPEIDRPTFSLPRLVLSCLRLVLGHRQLKQVWDAGDTLYSPGAAPSGPPGLGNDRWCVFIGGANCRKILIYHHFQLYVISVSCPQCLQHLLWDLTYDQTCRSSSWATDPSYCFLHVCFVLVWLQSGDNGTNNEFDHVLLAGSLLAQPAARACDLTIWRKQSFLFHEFI